MKKDLFLLSPASIRRGPSPGSKPAQRHRRWADLDPELGWVAEFLGMAPDPLWLSGPCRVQSIKQAPVVLPVDHQTTPLPTMHPGHPLLTELQFSTMRLMVTPIFVRIAFFVT